MSMLSLQIDRLRSYADLYDGTTKPEMAKELQRPYLAQELREAADTIWQLRDDLQRANDAVRDAEHDESMAWDRVRKAEAENAKLRKLAADINMAAHMLCEAWEGSCSKEAEGMSLHAVCPISDTNELCVFGKLYDRMRELGIEDE